MIREIGIYNHPSIGDYIQDSIHGCLTDRNSAGFIKGWIPNRIISNKIYTLGLEYLSLEDRSFSARIIVGPVELLNVKTSVDWRILHDALISGHNVINTNPFCFKSDFIWKIKGSVKLCLV